MVMSARPVAPHSRTPRSAAKHRPCLIRISSLSRASPVGRRPLTWRRQKACSNLPEAHVRLATGAVIGVTAAAHGRRAPRGSPCLAWTAALEGTDVAGSDAVRVAVLRPSDAALVRRFTRVASAAGRGWFPGVDGRAAAKERTRFGRTAVVCQGPQLRVLARDVGRAPHQYAGGRVLDQVVAPRVDRADAVWGLAARVHVVGDDRVAHAHESAGSGEATAIADPIAVGVRRIAGHRHVVQTYRGCVRSNSAPGGSRGIV